MAKISTRLKLRTFTNTRALQSAVDSLTKHKRDKLLEKYANIYFESQAQRFLRQSGGGGVWPAIKESTKRKKVRALRGRDAILVDTLQLYRVLANKNHPSRVIRIKANGVDVGIGGRSRYQQYNSRGRRLARRRTSGILTLGRLAAIHQFGLGRNPQRRILVAPNNETRAKMRQATIEHFRRYAKLN